MVKYGDPEFQVHVAIGQFLSLLIYHLSTDELLPLSATTWGEEMSAWFTELEEVAAESSCCADLDLTDLSDAIGLFNASAADVAALSAKAVDEGDEELVEVVNHKYRDFQRGFTSQGGLPGREFYKHVIMAPGQDTGYAPVTYPGITEAVEAGNLTLAEEWVVKTTKGILVAADMLKT